MIDQSSDQVRPRQGRVALERAEADVAVRQPRQHRTARGAGLVVPLQGLAGLEQGERAGGVHAQGFQHLAGQHLAHPALQGQAAIAKARIGRLTRALGAQVQQAAGAMLTQLGEQKAAPVADLRVVGAKLVAVIAHGQGLRLVRR